MIALITAFLLLTAWLAFVLARLGVHHRLPLVLGPISLDRIPDRAAGRHGERLLFTCDRPAEWTVPALAGRYPDPLQWSARRIETTVGYVATVIHEARVRHGDRVAIFKRNHLDMHFLTAAVVRAGGIACPMSARFESQHVQSYLDHLGARVLVSDVPTLERVMAEGGALGGVTTIILAARRNAADARHRALRQRLLESRPDVDVTWLEDALARVIHELPVVARTADETLYLVHSSGTTGVPKAVILTNGAQSHAVRGWLSYVHLSRTHDRSLVAVPNNHQAVILTFNSALLLGLRIHWMSTCAREDIDAEAIAAELACNGYTGFFAFPIAYTLLTEVDWRQHDVSRMRFWASTADAAHAAIIRGFVARGSAFRSIGLPLRGSVYLDAQGSSEVGTPSVLRYITAYTRDIGRRIGRPGSTPFGPRIRIVKASGDRVRPGDAGRLEVRGRTLFGGYWNDAGRTDEAMRDGWFFTGDVVREADDGNLVQLDREVDVIHTSFGPVYSLPIEEIMHEHPAVFDVCVYGARQPDGTQAPAAAVALRPGTHADPDALWRELNARLTRREQLAALHVIPWSAFPIGITGKTLKRVFRDRTEVASAQCGGDRVPPDDMGARVPMRIAPAVAAPAAQGSV